MYDGDEAQAEVQQWNQPQQLQLQPGQAQEVLAEMAGSLPLVDANGLSPREMRMRPFLFTNLKP